MGYVRETGGGVSNEPIQPNRPVQVASGPQWQALNVGDRVKVIGARRRGTVMSIIQHAPMSGITTHVSVRWDTSGRQTYIWPTDCLVLLDEPGGETQ